jgi:CrcB protein
MPRERLSAGLLAAVFVGGSFGALARAGVVEWLAQDPWPWATFAVNLAGSFVLGLVTARPPVDRALLGAGFCGALTTFSAFQLELLEMLDDGALARAAAYASASILAGLVAVRVGRGLS